MNPGSIVRCRNREWVLVPSDKDDVLALRPLTGTSDDVVCIHRGLMNLVCYTLASEWVSPASFRLPSAEDVSDATSAYLLWQAVRLTLREGATPFRSLGRISIRPRKYQFVPLMMALRQDPVRLFIADDVGVGKTIEALLIARELWDRGEIRRVCVLCPPYLCEQWAKELAEKFNLEAEVIRSGTVSVLERRTPPGKSIYEHFPIQVISIDWVKSDRNKHQFLQFCPEMVIVDEAHGAAEASSHSQQERHQLLQAVAQDAHRHLILLTATPHSGIEEAFRSLLGLLRPEFHQWNISDLDEQQRIALARHFVQRTRRDIEKDWEGEHCFPERETSDETYQLSDLYRRLFDKTYAFCSEIVRTGAQLAERQRRVRYWGALALLRCVMSSPAAAVAALEERLKGVQNSDADEAPEYASFVFEPHEERTDDETPVPPIEATEVTLPESERRKLRELRRLAEEIRSTGQDTKVARCAQVVHRLLREGFHPIIWCRYVATAEYVGEQLRQAAGDEWQVGDVQVVVITGRLADDERRAKIEEIDPDRPRILVATDCLSEGINLQDKFTAVLHYDLPWNPNRLEQREGRVDRYGQPARKVKAIRFFGRDNPVDGVVIRVLLDKAREIHRTLGTHVPVPEESESVTEAVLNALFMRGQNLPANQQLPLFDDLELVAAFHRRWERDAERERINRTRFAQRALKPEEIARELEATDAVLGDPEAVREFVLAAAQRIGAALGIRWDIRPAPKNPKVFRIPLAPDATTRLPEVVRLALPQTKETYWSVSFISPTPEGAEYLGRNHPFVTALARFLFEAAMNRPGNTMVCRCGVLRTRAVARLTTLLLLRVRYLIEQPNKTPLLSEEVLVLGYQQPCVGADPCAGPDAQAAGWLSSDEALRLLASATPDANMPLEEKRELVRMVLTDLGDWQAPHDSWGNDHPLQQRIREHILKRAAALQESHKRIRQALSQRTRGLEVRPQFPPDFLGILVLQPVVSP
jgi:superfamily II DNA or RNA helicase